LFISGGSRRIQALESRQKPKNQAAICFSGRSRGIHAQSHRINLLYVFPEGAGAFMPKAKKIKPLYVFLEGAGAFMPLNQIKTEKGLQPRK
jgi:hypothetical protein